MARNAEGRKICDLGCLKSVDEGSRVLGRDVT